MKLIAERIVELALKIQQIPAPTFEEINRAHFVQGCFEDEDLSDVTIDKLGNVFGRLPGKDSDRSPLVVSAHLDTVFPSETPLTLRREKDRIYGPGLGDNSFAVASLVGLIWMIRQRAISLPGDLWLVANVGEEGLGDLNGMKAVVNRFGQNPAAYVVLEGTALGQVYHKALRVRRYRFTFRTAGGHSWAHYGRKSAIHEAAKFISTLSKIDFPTNPRTTYNVGIIEGGRSVNSIAPHASFELDLRSESPELLEKIIMQVTHLANKFKSKQLEIEMEIIGERPAGSLPASHPLVQLAANSLRKHGLEPKFRIGSTDANIPLSKGLPAVCIGITNGGGGHTIEEFILTKPIETGLFHLEDVITGVWDLPQEAV